MLRFKQYIVEAAEARGILHLPHAAEFAFHPDKTHLSSALNRISQVARGTAPITRKIDDKMSFQIKREDDGKIAVKYKGAGAKYNYSQEDIQAQHGNKPHVAGPLSDILEHAHKFMPKKAGEYQGGYLFGSSADSRTTKEGRTSYEPNTVKYSMDNKSEEGSKLAKSSLGVVVHSKLDKDGRPTPVGAGEFNSHPDVHMMSHVISPEERKVPSAVMNKINEHLDAAHQLAKEHAHAHHEGHQQHLVSYGNSYFDTNKKLNVKDYKKFVTAKAQKEIDKVKTDKAKNLKKAALQSSLEHIDKHADKFDRSFKIYHHVQKATETLAHSLAKTAHGGYKSHIGDNETGGEGVFSAATPEWKENIKIVPRDFTVANRQRSAMFQASRAQVKK